MALSAPHAVILVVVTALNAGTVLAIRNENPDEVEQKKLPNDTPVRIVRILEMKDLATFSARDVRWALEKEMGLPRDSFLNEKPIIKEQVGIEIERIKEERKKRVRFAGHTCSGTRDFLWHQGTCKDY